MIWTWRKKGMAGFVLKNHYAPTAGRAAVIRRLYPQLNAVGSITLDSGVGGHQPHGSGNHGSYGRKSGLVPHV